MADGAVAWPRAVSDSRTWCVLTFRPGTEPVRTLAEPFIRTWQFDPTDPRRETRLTEWIESLQRRGTLRGLLDATDDRLQEKGQSKPTAFLLYIDQGEELYVRAEPHQRRCFSKLVAEGLPDPRLRALMSMRADFNYTHKKQTGGSGQYGKVAGFIEPLPAEHPTGFEFVDDITGGSIPREFIPACEKGFKEAVKKGPLIGFPIVGVRCTINDGASHPVDSSEIAFRTAALMGFREAYMNAKPTILEPIMRVEVQFPEEFQGAVMGQLNQRRGTIISSEKQEGFVQAMAEVPLNDMFGYSTDLRSATQGKGEFTMEFQKYAEVPKQQREVMVTEFRNKKDK